MLLAVIGICLGFVQAKADRGYDDMDGRGKSSDNTAGRSFSCLHWLCTAHICSSSPSPATI